MCILASVTIMRRTCKPLFWRATRPVNTADCMNEWKYFLKFNINISIIIRFKQYLPSIIQSVEFAERAARQNNGLYVLRMIVKLAYWQRFEWLVRDSSCSLFISFFKYYFLKIFLSMSFSLSIVAVLVSVLRWV